MDHLVPLGRVSPSQVSSTSGGKAVWGLVRKKQWQDEKEDENTIRRMKVVVKSGRSNEKNEMERNSKLVGTKKAAKHGADCGRAKV